MTALSPGIHIGRYIMLAPLGAGAMGVVYAAYDPELDRKIALKLLKYRNADARRTSRLQREAQALAKLDHRNVVTVHDVGTDDGRLFVAMEFVEGQTLRTWMRIQAERPWREIIAVFIDAGRGLAAAHHAGLVHRDFKPENVMLGDDGRVRVMDFGLVRGLAELGSDARVSTEPSAALLDQALTQTGAQLGTPAYMSPEQSARQTTDARADQFSFCVALYEALYGCRPFPSVDMGERLEAIAGRRLAAPLRATKSPSRLLRILSRGLAAKPEQRWPSMDALLDALSDDPPARWRKRGLALLGVGALAGAALAGGLTLQRGQRACAGMRVHLAGVWEEAQRDAVRGAIEGTGLSYAADTWARVERALDDYTQRWLSARVDACEATQRGEQSAQLLDLRMACLDERLEHVRATVDALSDPGPGGVRVASKALSELPDIERCADLEALSAEHPPPEDPRLAAQVALLNETLISAKVLALLAKNEQSRALIEDISRALDPLDYAPLTLELVMLRGELERNAGELEAALQSFERGLDLALRLDQGVKAARAASELMLLNGHKLARQSEAERWAKLADPLSEAHEHTDVRARFIMYRGMVAGARGDHHSALVDHQRALELREQRLGPVTEQVATALNNIGYTLQRLGRYSEARAAHQRALEIDRLLVGPSHPNVAHDLSNLGSLAKRAGELSEASELHTLALEIRERALAPGHPDIGGSHNSLGSLAKRRGELDEARRHFERARDIFEAQFGPEHPFMAGVLNNLGTVALKRGDHEGAARHLERALEIAEASRGPDHPDVALTLHNIGELSLARGDDARAEEVLSRARAVFEASYGPDHPIVATTTTTLAMAQLELGELPAALELLERAHAIHGESEAAPLERAHTLYGLARVLWELPPARGGERGRASALMLQASELLIDEVEGVELRADIDAWLRAHPSPGAGNP